MACYKIKALPIQRLQIKFFKSAAAFSSQPAPVVQEPLSHFRTTENNPTLHTKDHIGKFYTIPQDLRNKLFHSGGIPKEWDVQMKSFNETSLLIRQPAIEIMSVINKIDFSDPAIRFILCILLKKNSY
ncbi:28S ribosomal protein S29, mitochondrial [Caerostris extrusa]|uniref:Small ribosomal subunit protein mS29 n=1 Tax=Caerostris extrusa TaxID=172846 RepID=A0AAV4P5J2_CAEEX|nr:28S ribosomal protein S29, mitochondrial [Caerostris extrusa]